jgi:hypothetical protein
MSQTENLKVNLVFANLDAFMIDGQNWWQPCWWVEHRSCRKSDYLHMTRADSINLQLICYWRERANPGKSFKDYKQNKYTTITYEQNTQYTMALKAMFRRFYVFPEYFIIRNGPKRNRWLEKSIIACHPLNGWLFKRNFCMKINLPRVVWNLIFQHVVSKWIIFWRVSSHSGLPDGFLQTRNSLLGMYILECLEMENFVIIYCSLEYISYGNLVYILYGP